MMRAYAAWLALALALSPLGAFAADAPRVSISSLMQLRQPLPLPYAEGADAVAQIDAAFARARTSHKRVLVDFGGNWCADCRLLAGVMELPEVAAFVRAHYEVVSVDVGRFDRNLAVVRRMGVSELQGVPTVVIATADGRAVNITNSAELADARSMTPQGIADWLARYAE